MTKDTFRKMPRFLAVAVITAALVACAERSTLLHPELRSGGSDTSPPMAGMPCIGNPNPALAMMLGCTPLQPQPQNCFINTLNGVGAITCY